MIFIFLIDVANSNAYKPVLELGKGKNTIGRILSEYLWLQVLYKDASLITMQLQSLTKMHPTETEDIF